jgi:K+-transporting ATPase ATPase C chain
MIRKLTSEFIISIKIFIVMLLITGAAYTAVVTWLGNALFQEQVQGSLLIKETITEGVKDEKIVGSSLIAQKFSDDKYFWVRPSAVDYNALPSAGSNLGMTSKDLKSSIQEKTKMFKKYSNAEIPADLLSSSASGLDPEISPEAAFYQVSRIAEARMLDSKEIEDLKQLIRQNIKQRDYGFLGEKRINVLELNLALDARYSYPTQVPLFNDG